MGENYVGITDKGKARDNNEDIFIAKKLFKKHCILACVIDGVGGYDGGEIAAQLTRDAIIEQLDRVPEDLPAAMVSALASANQKIFKEKETNSQYDKMACVVTLAIADLEKNRFSYAHVGDTRLYLFRDRSLVKITNDHSTVGFLEESGRLTESAAMQHPKRNEVNKALGYEANLSLAKDFVDTGESPFLPGDMILLCSDGLTDMIPSAVIIDILQKKSNLKVKASELVEAANQAGGKDNITVVLVHNNKLPSKHEATKPPAVLKNTVDLQAEIEPVQLREIEPVLQEATEEKRTKGRGLIMLLLFLCAISFAGFAWFYMKSREKEKEPKLLMPPPTPVRNVNEQNLADSIKNAANNKTVSLLPGQSLHLSDSLVIHQDSLHFRGNGAILKADSLYKGPAFVLSARTKYFLLDSVTLQDFKVGVLVQQKGLHLRNVRFTNCVVPVQLAQQFAPNAPISGAFVDNIFKPQDSLRK
jgi:serine/threonine protein phosphatase PrpC